MAGDRKWKNGAFYHRIGGRGGVKHIITFGEEVKGTEEIEQPRGPFGTRLFGGHSTQATKTQKKTLKPRQTQKPWQAGSKRVWQKSGQSRKVCKHLEGGNKCYHVFSFLLRPPVSSSRSLKAAKTRIMIRIMIIITCALAPARALDGDQFSSLVNIGQH